MPPKKAERGAPGGSGGADEEAKEDLVAKEAPVAVVSKAALTALGEEVAASWGGTGCCSGHGGKGGTWF